VERGKPSPAWYRGALPRSPDTLCRYPIAVCVGVAPYGWPRFAGDFFTSWSVHEVNAERSDFFAALFLAEMNAQLVDRPGWERDVLVTVLAGSLVTEGSTVTTETIDGEVVAFVAERDIEDVGFAWYHAGTIYLVWGVGEDEVRAFVQAYVTEQNN